jgi:hypothetical protein
MAEVAVNLSQFTDDQLLAVKQDLEQRLARFQRAFFDKHGRNPNDEEREPAKPAIKRYRAVCQELAKREAAAKQVSMDDDEDDDMVSARPQQKQQQKQQQQQQQQPSTAMTEQAGDQMLEVNRAGIAAAQAQASSTRDDNASRSSAEGAYARCQNALRRLTPSSAMTDLLVSWAQFTAIFGDLTYTVTASVQQEFPHLTLPTLAPWAATFNRNVFPLCNLFNLDIKSLQVQFDLAFLNLIGWRETHLAFIVLIPLVISGITIILLRSLGDIARLILFTLSVLLLIFGASAYGLVGLASYIRGDEDARVLNLDTTTLDFVLIIGGSGLFASILLFFYEAHKTHSKIRSYLQTEVDDLAEKLYGVKAGLETVAMRGGGGGGGGGGAAGGSTKSLNVQEALPNASLLNEMLQDDDEAEELVGGRAKDSAEFLRQMNERAQRKKHGQAQYHMPHFSSFIKTLLAWLVLSVGALFLWLRHARMLPPSVLRALPDEYSNNYYVGAIFATAGSALILAYELLSLSRDGQGILDAIFTFLKQAYIGFLMVIVSFLYIPISRQALGVFICKRQECQQGEWFPLQSPGSESSVWTYLTQFASTYLEAARALGGPGFNTSASTAAILSMRPADSCTPCQWLGNERALLPIVYGGGNVSGALLQGDYGGAAIMGSCPADLATELCPPSSSMRLTAAPQIDCLQQWVFYIPGVILTLAMFTLGVPYMFYNLTRRHVAMYESLDIYVVDKKASASTPAARRVAAAQSRSAYSALELEDLWRRRVQRAARNRAKNLYADFEYRWRYWKLIILAMKFLVVVVDVLKTVFPSHVAAPALMLTIHVVMFFFVFFARPYIDNKPNMLAIAISFANVFNYCVILTAAARIPSEPWMVSVLLVVNFVLPLLAILLGWYMNKRKARVMNEKLRAATHKRQYVPFPQVQKKRKTIERHMNEFTLRVLASWTWGVLIASVVAGELIFIGTFAEAALTPVSGHTASHSADGLTSADVVDCYREEHARTEEFLGFSTWKVFTQNCCCMSRANATDVNDLDEHVTELWSCANTRNAKTSYVGRLQRPVIYKERQRRPFAPGTTVSPVRKFCDTVFRDQYGSPTAQEPVFNNVTGRLGIPWYSADGAVLQWHEDFW